MTVAHNRLYCIYPQPLGCYGMGRKATDPIGKELFMIVLRNGIAFFDSSKRVQYPQNLVELSFKCSYKVSEVSRELGISSRQLERMFHAALGLTPKAWMREQRMVREIGRAHV